MKTLFVIYLLFTTGFISLILYHDYKDHHYTGECKGVLSEKVENSYSVTSIGSDGLDCSKCKILKNNGHAYIGSQAISIDKKKCKLLKNFNPPEELYGITIPKNVKLIKVNFDWSKVTISKSDTFELPKKVTPYLFNHGYPYATDKYGRPLDSNIEVDSIIFIDK
jgi:hypothetical protein